MYYAVYGVNHAETHTQISIIDCVYLVIIYILLLELFSIVLHHFTESCG